MSDGAPLSIDGRLRADQEKDQRATIRPVKLTVLGATGRIGHHVVDQALAAGHEVTVLARSSDRYAMIDRWPRVVVGTVENVPNLVNAIAEADAVISAIGPDGNAPDQVDVLGRGMENTVEAMHQTGVRRT